MNRKVKECKDMCGFFMEWIGLYRREWSRSKTLVSLKSLFGFSSYFGFRHNLDFNNILIFVILWFMLLLINFFI